MAKSVNNIGARPTGMKAYDFARDAVEKWCEYRKVKGDFVNFNSCPNNSHWKIFLHATNTSTLSRIPDKTPGNWSYKIGISSVPGKCYIGFEMRVPRLDAQKLKRLKSVYPNEWQDIPNVGLYRHTKFTGGNLWMYVYHAYNDDTTSGRYYDLLDRMFAEVQRVETDIRAIK